MISRSLTVGDENRKNLPAGLEAMQSAHSMGSDPKSARDVKRHLLDSLYHTHASHPTHHPSYLRPKAAGNDLLSCHTYRSSQKQIRLDPLTDHIDPTDPVPEQNDTVLFRSTLPSSRRFPTLAAALLSNSLLSTALEPECKQTEWRRIRRRHNPRTAPLDHRQNTRSSGDSHPT